MSNRSRKMTPSLSSGSMADIAFLLLIFFMVATSIQREQSISMQLPPSYNGPPGQINESRVLSILINKADEIMVENIETDQPQIMIENQLNKMVRSNVKPYINIKISKTANYNTYIDLLAQVKSSIRTIKEQYASELFNRKIIELNRDQFAALNQRLAIKISESEF